MEPWEVIRIKWGHEDEAPRYRISALVSVLRGLAASHNSVPGEDTRSWKKDGPHQNPTLLAL